MLSKSSQSALPHCEEQISESGIGLSGGIAIAGLNRVVIVALHTLVFGQQSYVSGSPLLAQKVLPVVPLALASHGLQPASNAAVLGIQVVGASGLLI